MRMVILPYSRLHCCVFFSYMNKLSSVWTTSTLVCYTVCSNQGFIAIQFLELKGIFGDKIWPGCDTKVDFSTLGQTGVPCPHPGLLLVLKTYSLFQVLPCAQEWVVWDLLVCSVSNPRLLCIGIKE